MMVGTHCSNDLSRYYSTKKTIQKKSEGDLQWLIWKKSSNS
jgi:hypothetical protein